MIQVNWINIRSAYEFRKLELEECICFLTSETAEKMAVFMTKKITYKNPRRQHERTCFPVHPIFRPEECKACSLDGKLQENTIISLTMQYTLTAGWPTWISYGITVFCRIQELVNLR